MPRQSFVPGRRPSHGLSGHFPCRADPKSTACSAVRANPRPVSAGEERKIVALEAVGGGQAAGGGGGGEAWGRGGYWPSAATTSYPAAWGSWTWKTSWIRHQGAWTRRRLSLMLESAVRGVARASRRSSRSMVLWLRRRWPQSASRHWGRVAPEPCDSSRGPPCRGGLAGDWENDGAGGIELGLG